MKTYLFIGLGTLAIATVAPAATISYSQNIPTQPASFTDQFNLTKFDTNLGTLTGVTLELDARGTASVEVFSLGTRAFTGATADFQFILSGPDGSQVQVPLSAGPFDGTAVPGLNIIPGNSVTGTFTTNVSGSNWASYEGAGSQDLALTALVGNGTYSGSPQPGVSFIGFGGIASAGGTAQVIYTFDAAPIPEPVTLGLIGSALLGLGLIRRYRKP